MLKYVYIDYNELVELEKLTQRDKEALEYVLRNHKILFSFWHIVEATGRTKKKDAISIVRFMESLEPCWLRDRVNIQKDETRAEFFRQRYSCSSPVVAICRSFLQLVADIRIPFMYHTPSYFVSGWKENPSVMKPIKDVQEQYPSVFNVGQTAQAEGKFTREFNREILRRYVSERMPRHDPQGKFLHPTEKDAFVQQIDLQDLVKYPSINTEFLFAEFKRSDRRRRGKESDVADNQHIVSGLTYAHVFVTRDNYLRDGAKYVKGKACIPVAEIYDSLASFVEAE